MFLSFGSYWYRCWNISWCDIPYPGYSTNVKIKTINLYESKDSRGPDVRISIGALEQSLWYLRMCLSRYPWVPAVVGQKGWKNMNHIFWYFCKSSFKTHFSSPKTFINQYIEKKNSFLALVSWRLLQHLLKYPKSLLLSVSSGKTMKACFHKMIISTKMDVRKLFFDEKIAEKLHFLKT